MKLLKKIFIKKNLSRLVMLVLLFMTIAFSYNKWFSDNDKFPKYIVSKGEFIIDIEAIGEMKAIESHVINSPSRIWGNIRIVKMIEEGTVVDSGDFLIQFDTAEFMEQLQRKQNELESAKANLEVKMANIAKQTSDLVSQLQIEEYNLEQTKLQAQNAIYEAENKRKEIEYTLKKAKISYNRLKEKIQETKKINDASIHETQLAIEQAKISVERAQEELNQLTLISPTHGLVVYKEIWGPGGLEKVKVGSSPWRNQPLLEIPSQSGMKVKLQVNEVDISRLKIDQEVHIHLDAIIDTFYTGSVTSISSLAHTDRKTEKNVFDVEVNVNEKDERLKPGMSATCQIFVEKIADTLFIPIDAITTKDEKTGVYDENNKFIEIETGKSNADFIVVEKGLSDGDLIRLRAESDNLPDASHEMRPKKKKSNKKSSKHRRVVIVG